MRQKERAKEFLIEHMTKVMGLIAQGEIMAESAYDNDHMPKLVKYLFRDAQRSIDAAISVVKSDRTDEYFAELLDKED